MCVYVELLKPWKCESTPADFLFNYYVILNCFLVPFNLLLYLCILKVCDNHIICITDIILTFITQQSTPVLLAVTMPRDITGSMDAAWVGQTLVAELTLPAIVTPENHKSNAMTDDKTSLRSLANALR